MKNADKDDHAHLSSPQCVIGKLDQARRGGGVSGRRRAAMLRQGRLLPPKLDLRPQCPSVDPAPWARPSTACRAPHTHKRSSLPQRSKPFLGLVKRRPTPQDSLPLTEFDESSRPGFLSRPQKSHTRKPTAQSRRPSQFATKEKI